MLHVNAASKNKRTGRQRVRRVVFPPFIKTLPIIPRKLFVPRLAQFQVDKLHKAVLVLVVRDGHKFIDEFVQVHPRGTKGIYMITLCLCFGILRHPAATSQNFGVRAVSTTGNFIAMRANYPGGKRQRRAVLVLVPNNIFPFVFKFASAMRARQHIDSLVAFEIILFNFRSPLYCRCRNKDVLLIVKVRRTLDSQLERRTFLCYPVTVDFIGKQNTDRARRKPRRGVRPDKRDITARIMLHAYRGRFLAAGSPPFLAFF